MPNPVDIKVGNGPVTTTGIYGAVISWLGFAAALIATLAGSLPAGVSPNAGVGLAVASGAVATLLHLATGLSRAKFADAKARVMAGQSGYEVVYDSMAEPTDTNVPPPVEPA